MAISTHCSFWPRPAPANDPLKGLDAYILQAMKDWDLPGLRAAVQVQGTLNDASDIDEGWTAEIAFPWRGLKTLAGSRPVPPRDGDVWRLDFSRFELLDNCGVTVEPHPGWALNKHGVYDSHLPECFSFVHFSDKLLEP